VGNAQHNTTNNYDPLLLVIMELIKPYTPLLLNNAVKMLLQYTNKEDDIIRFASFIKQFRGDPTVAVKYFVYDYMASILGPDVANYISNDDLSLKSSPESFVRFLVSTKLDLSKYPIIVSYLNMHNISLDFLDRMKYDKLE